MIEIVYNKEKEKATGNEEYFCIPRNIRQIGTVPKENKIYLEDYGNPSSKHHKGVEAEEHVKKEDSYRKKYSLQITGQTWSMAEHYDLCLRSDEIGIEEAGKLALQMIRSAQNQEK